MRSSCLVICSAPDDTMGPRVTLITKIPYHLNGSQDASSSMRDTNCKAVRSGGPGRWAGVRINVYLVIVPL